MLEVRDSMHSNAWYELCFASSTMDNILQQIDIDSLNTVIGGADDRPKPVGGDGDALARHDVRFPPLEDALKGKTKGQG